MFLEFKELNNKTEIGVKPASGLRPPKLKADEINDKPVCKSEFFPVQYFLGRRVKMCKTYFFTVTEIVLPW